MAGLALIDYGAGNLHSVHNALKAAGADDVVVTADPETVVRADRIVLPGVGAFAHCMEALSAIDGMVAAMEQRVRTQGVPFLGICVGMQLLADAGVFDRGLKYRSMVLPDVFIDQASPEAMYRVAGMDAAQIEARVLDTLGVAVVGMRA